MPLHSTAENSSPRADLPRALALLVFVCCLVVRGAVAAEPPRPTGRVIVLGFDGADARTVARLMDAGQMPHCARLRESGSFAPLASTVPAESPVSWASLNSGCNPGETGIPGFIRRTFDSHGTPQPDFGHLAHETRALADMQIDGAQGFLASRSSTELAWMGGCVAFAAFFVLLAFLLRIRRATALLLSAFLGAVGAWSLVQARGYLPREIDDVVANPTQTAGFYETAARAGVKTIVLDAAMEWDRPDVPNLELLAGLGVPDVRSNNGDWFVYTTRTSEFGRAPRGRATSTGGLVFHVDERDGRIESSVYGPRNSWSIDLVKRELESIRETLATPGLPDAKVDALIERQRSLAEHELPRLLGEGEFQGNEVGRCALPLQVEIGAGQAVVTIGGQSQTIREGAWSDWYHLTFALNPILKVKAITRCRLARLANPFELYVDFLQIDPVDPMFWQPVSRPNSFARDLVRAAEIPFETVGWACLTMPFKDREIDPVGFLQDIEFTHATRVKLLEAALARDDWRLLVDIESTPDRVQHMLYQYADPEHPSYDAVAAARTVTYFGREVALSEAIDETYRAMDRLVGEVVLKHLRPNDTLVICADHGFQSFRRQVHLNNWLAREGYLVLLPDASAATSGYLEFVDWTRTRAYALGLGGIYLNLSGREHEGIVQPDEAAGLLAEIATKLAGLRDPARDVPAVRATYVTARTHSGPNVPHEADLQVGFEAGYRVSWATSTGDIALIERDGAAEIADVFADNRSTWSGDHVSVAIDLVQGAFLCNRRVEVPAGGLSVLHVAPTVLALLGVAVPAECDLAPLRVQSP